MRAPGSKSVSNRALLLAALGGGVCRIKGLLHSDDTQVCVCVCVWVWVCGCGCGCLTAGVCLLCLYTQALSLSLYTYIYHVCVCVLCVFVQVMMGALQKLGAKFEWEEGGEVLVVTGRGGG